MNVPPVVAETSVGTDLLQSFKILTQLVFQLIGSDLKYIKRLISQSQIRYSTE